MYFAKVTSFFEFPIIFRYYDALRLAYDLIGSIFGLF